MTRFAFIAGLFASLALATTEAPSQEKAKPGTGLKLDPKLTKLLRAADLKKHDHHVRALPKITAAKFDCRDLGLVGPRQDQGSCGDCSYFQSVGCAEAALYKAGQLKNDGKQWLSRQMAVDYIPQNGACDGGNGYVVLSWLKQKGNGLVLNTDYGPYVARPQQPRSVTGKTLYTILDWGFCDHQDAVASVQSIKTAMATYGPIAANVSADLLFGVQPGQVVSGRGGQIDHAIKLVGWDDAKGKAGAWLLENSWGRGWGEDGFCWIEYGSSSVGHDAEWCTAQGVVPPPIVTPPFFLTVDAVAIGEPAGYLTLTMAVAFGQPYADAQQVTVLVKDAKDVLAKTLSPTPPPTPTCPPGYHWDGTQCVPDVAPGPGPGPGPAPCRPFFHLRGRPHWRC